MNPTARRTDVIVQDVGPDTLVYDRLTDTAHSLSTAAGFVYRSADGSRTIEELTSGMSTELGVEPDVQVIEAALWQLEQANLLEAAPQTDSWGRRMSRRQAVQRFGAALAVAAVTSIVAPTPAMARSGGGLGRGPKGPKSPKWPKGPKGPKGRGPKGHRGRKP
ncbi:MAG TPA: hypothetical protein VFX39_04900 [Gemmatimonadaceae bacterium]|nr:hypothetical protein [Gemmatimonadaceae bacterium]